MEEYTQISNKHIKRYSVSYQELPIKTRRYHYKTTGMAKMRNTSTTKCRPAWNNKNSHLLLVGMQNDTIILDDSLLLCPRSWKLCSHRKLHTNIYRSFTCNRIWKQPRCSSADKKNNKIWTIQTIRYYPPLKRYKLSSHKKTWKKFQCVFLSERV